ncbi:uncharacterized protein KNAG_0B05205 [Huiozyma naganishii CBS 8797]|uniref:Uncharacterized protein n=1 Tax=Huiozyma naganishii (strain ATCC MYA-139 / BCRC 22969 / CBS 8797 / KCTC 17520 / NBRC 10181 / NCYC 3082 / Yp74L-3) TaxID=1071383 RepID=J7RHD7_HUIN7|nr:hypothetical protein KNAG_0B05205 [Kazachstania naganishii CBS 8797]CCK68953.1 hypothetical protein KNAG_0B05205 [Kazachstania naganishii CBS 8797]
MKSKHMVTAPAMLNNLYKLNLMLTVYEEAWEDLRSNKLDVLYYFATVGGRRSFSQLWEVASLDGLERCLPFDEMGRYKQFGFVPPMAGVEQQVSQVASASIMDTFTYSEGSGAKYRRYRVNGRYTTPARNVPKSCVGLMLFRLWHNVGFMSQIRGLFPVFGNLRYFSQLVTTDQSQFDFKPPVGRKGYRAHTLNPFSGFSGLQHSSQFVI